MSHKSKTHKKTAARKKSSTRKPERAAPAAGGGRISRILSAVGSILRRGKDRTPSTAASKASAGTNRPGAQTARTVRRQTDIPMDVLNNTYTPSATSSKAGFRSDGADHQQDQELASGVADERWNDEDQFTNKSGDPRIGTRGRTYEPGESRDASRSQ